MILRKKWLVTLLGLLLAVGSNSARAQMQTAEAALRPGDALRITVWRNSEFSGDFTVLEDGSLAHPLFRDIRVAGMPLRTVESSIRSYLTRFESEPHFVIQPLYRIMVGGEVRTPSVYQLPPSATLAEAVATAGGVTDRAKLETVRLQRGGFVAVVDLTDPDPAGLANSPIRSGDALFVERRVSVFREYIAPAGSIVAALTAIANLILR